MYVTNGLKMVTCAGFFLNNRSATLTIRSNPPAACIHAAADITATIMSITSIGGAVGCRPNTNVSIPNPIPPMTPSPMPPRRAPMMIAVKTKANCKIISFIGLRLYFSNHYQVLHNMSYDDLEMNVSLFTNK